MFVFLNLCLLKNLKLVISHLISELQETVVFAWFESLHSSQQFQLCRDVFSWVEPVLSKDNCVLLKARPLCLESSILPLSHCAPPQTMIS